MHILIVEDDADTANLFSNLFRAKGYRVNIAHTAEEGLKIYSKSLQEAQLKHSLRVARPYEAILLDYNLPDRNGLEVAKEILAINPHQRIIFVSAYVEDTLSSSIKEMSIPVEVLQKPVSNDVLMNTIEDKEFYDELKRLGLKPEEFKKAGFNHEVFGKILDILKKAYIFPLLFFLTEHIPDISTVL